MDNCIVVFFWSKYNLEVIRVVIGNDKCVDCGSFGKNKNYNYYFFFLNYIYKLEKSFKNLLIIYL